MNGLFLLLLLFTLHRPVRNQHINAGPYLLVGRDSTYIKYRFIYAYSNNSKYGIILTYSIITIYFSISFFRMKIYTLFFQESIQFQHCLSIVYV